MSFLLVLWLALLTLLLLLQIMDFNSIGNFSQQQIKSFSINQLFHHNPMLLEVLHRSELLYFIWKLGNAHLQIFTSILTLTYVMIFVQDIFMPTQQLLNVFHVHLGVMIVQMGL